jgi:MFS superfamily sulfate permease-like transporter
MTQSDQPAAAAVRFRLPPKADILASVVVFLVALPLCMGIAIASGAPPEKAAAVGILTGIVGGLVVGSLGGSPLQVSGPAAGLSVLVLELTQKHGWETLGLLVLLCGALQLAAGLLKLGQWFRAVSPAVIYGMLAGIGILILASQFHIMLDDRPRGNGLANVLSLPAAVWKGLVPSSDVTHDDAARIGLLTIAVMVLWKPLAPKKLKGLPAPLLAVAVAAGVTALLGLPIHMVTVPDRLLDAASLPSTGVLGDPAAWPPLLFAGASLALIASAETLLSASAVDKLHGGTRTDYDRELAAQGVGNILCGLLGALPMTGVIVRSATNVEAGARTRASAVLHGVWLLAAIVLFPAVLRWVPTASLAAILVYTGFKLINPAAVRALWKYGAGEVVIFAATVVTIVLTDLLTGVLLGVALCVAKLVYVFARLRVRVVEEPEGGRTVLYLRGAATFLRLPKLAAALERVPPSTELHVHFEELTYIDHACLDLLLSWEKQHEATGGSLEIDWEGLHAHFHQYGKWGQAGGGPPTRVPATDGAAAAR